MSISSMTVSSSGPSRKSSRKPVRPHPHHEWRVQGLCDDGMAHRLLRGARRLIKAMAKLQSQSATNAASISQWASVEALNGTQDFIPGFQKLFEGRRDLVVSMLNQAKRAGMSQARRRFLCLSFHPQADRQEVSGGKTIATDADFAEELLEAEGVAVVHGAAFGLSPFFRISYATSNAVLEEACRRIQRFCGSLTN